MSRRKAAPKRKLLPDPKYKSEILAKFVNVLMLDGKKSTSEQIVYRALERVAEKKNIKVTTSEDGTSSESGSNAVIELFNEVLDAVRPRVEVRSRRVGGATYQIPVEVRGERGTALAMRWLIQFSRKRGEKSMHLRLAGEMADALEGRGAAVKKREDTHRMAKANQAFAHYRW